jgi:hypothetical protein
MQAPQKRTRLNWREIGWWAALLVLMTAILALATVANAG